MKRTILMLTVFLVLASTVSFAQADDSKYYKKYSPPVTFTIAKNIPAGDTTLPEGDTVESNASTRLFALHTGIIPKVVWWASGDAYRQKVALAIASGDIPDYMEVDINSFRYLAKANMLADLTDLYRELAKPDWKMQYEDSGNRAFLPVTIKGRLMGLPSQQASGDGISLLWLRKDWLDKLGLAEPKTVDDIEKIALAFISRDPDGNGKADTTGMILSAKNYTASDSDIGNMGEFFANYGAFPKMWIKGSDGKVQYGSLMPGAVQALEKLNSWYKKGVIHKEFASLGDSAAQLISSNKCGIYFGPWWSSWFPLTDAVKNDPKGVWVSYGIPLSPSGKWVNGMINPAQSVGVISKKMKNPEIIFYGYNGGPRELSPEYLAAEKKEQEKMKGVALNHEYRPFRIITVPMFCIEDTHKYIQRVLNGEFTFAGDKLENELIRKFGKSDWGWYYSVIEMALKVRARDNPYQVIGDWSNSYGYMVGAKPLAAGNIEYVYNAFFGSTPTMETKRAFLDKLETTAYTKMIMGDTGGKSLSDYFASFVKDYLAQGGQDILKEVQAEVDALK